MLKRFQVSIKMLIFVLYNNYMKLQDINRLRRKLYTTAKYLGDVNALLRGKILTRILRRIVGKQSAKFLNKLFK